MSHHNHLTTPSNNPSYFWSQALDQSAIAPLGDGCTAMLDGTLIGHSYGHHVGGGNGNGCGHGHGHHNGGSCVPAAGAVALMIVALLVCSRMAR